MAHFEITWDMTLNPKPYTVEPNQQKPVRFFKEYKHYIQQQSAKKIIEDMENQRSANAGNEINWNWGMLSKNLDITAEDMKRWEIQREEEEKREEELLHEKCSQEWQAISTIKRKWIKIFWDISHSVGLKRCERSLLNENYQVWG